MVTHQPRLADRPGLRSHTHQAILLLRTVFTIAPILFGLDKFFNVMVDWTTWPPSRPTSSRFLRKRSCMPSAL